MIYFNRRNPINVEVLNLFCFFLIILARYNVEHNVYACAEKTVLIR